MLPYSALAVDLAIEKKHFQETKDDPISTQKPMKGLAECLQVPHSASASAAIANCWSLSKKKNPCFLSLLSISKHVMLLDSVAVMVIGETHLDAE